MTLLGAELAQTRGRESLPRISPEEESPSTFLCTLRTEEVHVLRQWSFIFIDQLLGVFVEDEARKPSLIRFERIE